MLACEAPADGIAETAAFPPAGPDRGGSGVVLGPAGSVTSSRSGRGEPRRAAGGVAHGVDGGPGPVLDARNRRDGRPGRRSSMRPGRGAAAGRMPARVRHGRDRGVTVGSTAGCSTLIAVLSTGNRRGNLPGCELPPVSRRPSPVGRRDSIGAAAIGGRGGSVTGREAVPMRPGRALREDQRRRGLMARRARAHRRGVSGTASPQDSRSATAGSTPDARRAGM